MSIKVYLSGLEGNGVHVKCKVKPGSNDYLCTLSLTSLAEPDLAQDVEKNLEVL